MDKNPPNVFAFENYREYLQAAYSYMKSTSRFFSYRYFSKVAGFTSPNILKLVMDGDRNLSKDAALKFAKGFRLNKTESAFFCQLVVFNQAKNSIEKQKAAENLLKFKNFRKMHPLGQAQYNYYAQWYFIPIRELVGAPYFVEDPEWVAKQLSPEITSKQAKQALKELEDLKLLTRNSDGKLIQSTSDVAATESIGSATVASWHKEMLNLAHESIDRFSSDQRELSASTVLVSKENYQKVKVLIQNFRDELVALTSEDPNPDVVCQIGLQLFPLTKSKGDSL